MSIALELQFLSEEALKDAKIKYRGVVKSWVFGELDFFRQAARRGERAAFVKYPLVRPREDREFWDAAKYWARFDFGLTIGPKSNGIRVEW